MTAQSITCPTPAVRIDKVGDPLPEAVIGDPAQLPAAAAAEIRTLMAADPLHFFLRVLTAWLSVAAAIAVAIYAGHWAVSVLVILFIGTRQNILGLLVHEQAHRLGLMSKRGDHLANFLCAFPLLITLEGYRRVHLMHHSHFFTEHDPDYRRKQGEAWTFPQRVRRFLMTIVCDLLGLNILSNFRGKRIEGDKREHRGTPGWARLAFYGVVAAALTLTGGWIPFLLYWMLPLLTVMQVIVRFGAICEHKYNLIEPTVAQATPMIEPAWWESLLLPNLNFTLHIYHHWYPAVPFAKLPRVHAIFKRQGLVREEYVFHGYTAYLRFLLTQPRGKTQVRTGSHEDHGRQAA